MARVVQRRTSPAYLTIVFVFLFLAAFTLAVLFYLEAGKAKKNAADDKDTLAKLATRSELSSSQVRKLMQERGTVIGQMQDQIAKLTEAITGQAGEADDAIETAEQIAAQLKNTQGLANIVAAMQQAMVAAGTQMQDLNEQLAAKTAELESKSKQISDLIAQQEAAMAQVRQEVTDLQQQLKQREDDLRAQLDQAKQQWQKIRQDLDSTVAARTQETEQLRLELQQAKVELERIKEGIRDPLAAKAITPLPDGEILQVVPELQLVYINLGKTHNLKPGQTFSIYPPTGIAEGAEKGMIVVTNVDQDIAGCKITAQSETDPIIIGDLISNHAFDRTRTYSFAVAGYFDLYGTGLPTSVGAEEVKTLIRGHGGTVVDELDIQTDFLVLGLAPARARRPRPEDPQSAQAVYAKQMKIYNQYQDTLTKAQDLNVPILTTNKFVAFMGYSPAQASAQ